MFPNALDGVKKIRTAELFILITAVIALVLGGLTIGAGRSGNTDTVNGATIAGAGILGVISAVLLFAAFILDLLGLSRASKDEKSFKNALLLTLAGIVLSVVSGVLTKNATVSGIVSTVNDLIGVAVFVMVVRGIMNLAGKLDRDDIRKKGAGLIKTMAAVYVLGIIAALVATLLQRNQTTMTIAGILFIVSGVLEIIVFLRYFGYLGKAVKMLEK
jgi:hypothetical protein